MTSARNSAIVGIASVRQATTIALEPLLHKWCNANITVFKTVLAG